MLRERCSDSTTAPAPRRWRRNLALAEIGCDFELALVELDAEGRPPASYLELNPWGVVPTLEHDGLVLSESAAILLYLADTFPEAQLAPPVATPERAELYQWLMYLTNTIQPTFMRFFYPERFADDEAAWPAVKRRAAEIAGAHFDRLEQEVASRPWLARESLSAADLFLFMLIRWGRNLDRPAWDRPGLRAYFQRIAARPATRRVLAEQGLDPPAF